MNTAVVGIKVQKPMYSMLHLLEACLLEAR